MRKITIIVLLILIATTVFTQKIDKDFKFSVSQTKDITDIFCNAGSLFSNDLSGYTTSGASEVEVGYYRAQAFETPGGTIEGITFWGTNQVISGSWQACTEAVPMIFNILFCENNAGLPGDTLITFLNVSVNAVPSGEPNFLGSFPIYQYDLVLPSPVSLTSGFVIIEGNTANSCWFMWLESGTGILPGAVYDPSFGGWWNQMSWALCLTGTAPSCLAPTMLYTINATDVSADFGWTENGSASLWDIEIGAAGFTPTGTPTYAGVTSNPFSFTGLTAGTFYDVYVRAFCDSGSTSVWQGPLTFLTSNCPPANQCNYLFDLKDDYGDGWDAAYISVIEGGVEIARITSTSAAETYNLAVCDSQIVELVWHKGFYDSEVSFVLNSPSGDTIFICPLGTPDTWPTDTTFFTFTSSCTATGLSQTNLSGNNICIFPNPTTGKLNITNVDNANIIVYNTIGEVVLNLNNVSGTIDLSELAENNYIIKVVTKNNVITKKFTLLK